MHLNSTLNELNNSNFFVEYILNKKKYLVKKLNEKNDLVSNSLYMKIFRYYPENSFSILNIHVNI